MYSYLLFWFPRRTNDLSVTHHSLEIVCTCCLLTSGIDFYWIDIFKYCTINWALMLKCFIYKKLGVIVRWLIGTWSCAQGVQGLSKSNNQILNPVDVGPSIFIGNYVWFPHAQRVTNLVYGSSTYLLWLPYMLQYYSTTLDQHFCYDRPARTSCEQSLLQTLGSKFEATVYWCGFCNTPGVNHM